MLAGRGAFRLCPERAIFSKDRNERGSIIVGNLTNIYFRGYKHIGLDADSFAQEAMWWAQQMEIKTTLNVEDVKAGFDFLMLTEASTRIDRLWSGGKRPLFIPAALRAGRFADTEEEIDECSRVAPVPCSQPRSKPSLRAFSWARSVDWRLATPSVEFAWEISPDLSDPTGIPHVLQLTELSDFLAEGKHPAEPLREALARKCDVPAMPA